MGSIPKINSAFQKSIPIPNCQFQFQICLILGKGKNKIQLILTVLFVLETMCAQSNLITYDYKIYYFSSNASVCVCAVCVCVRCGVCVWCGACVCQVCYKNYMYFLLRHVSWIFANQRFCTAVESWVVNLSFEQFPVYISCGIIDIS